MWGVEEGVYFQVHGRPESICSLSQSTSPDSQMQRPKDVTSLCACGCHPGNIPGRDLQGYTRSCWVVGHIVLGNLPKDNSHICPNLCTVYPVLWECLDYEPFDCLNHLGTEVGCSVKLHNQQLQKIMYSKYFERERGVIDPIHRTFPSLNGFLLFVIIANFTVLFIN